MASLSCTLNESLKFSPIKYLLIALFFGVLLSATSIQAATSLPVPRYVSLRSDQVNARVGPGLRYPIEWVFVRKKLPVKVTREFGHWRLVKDAEGAEGWIHQRMLSGLRTVVIYSSETTTLYARPTSNSQVLAKLESNVICQLIKVERDWIKIKIEDEKGWVSRDQVWGILPDEK